MIGKVMKAGTMLAKMITTPLSMSNRKRNILSSERGTRGTRGLLCRGLQIPLHLTLLTAHHTSTVNTSQSPLSISVCCYINEILTVPKDTTTSWFAHRFILPTIPCPHPVSSSPHLLNRFPLLQKQNKMKCNQKTTY